MLRLSRNRKKADRAISTLAAMTKEALYKVVIGRSVFIIDDGERRELLREPWRGSMMDKFDEGRFEKVSMR